MEPNKHIIPSIPLLQPENIARAGFDCHQIVSITQGRPIRIINLSFGKSKSMAPLRSSNVPSYSYAPVDRTFLSSFRRL
jgi:hypothetical protein